MNDSTHATATIAARPRVLLVCPPVFSYHLSIKAEFEVLGYDVTLWNDRGDDRTSTKIALRLLPNLSSSLLTRSFLERLERLDTRSVKHVLIVKGEGMSLDLLRSMREQMPQARFKLYFWDSVDNAPRATQIAPIFDSISTFDPVDAGRLNWGYRPLFSRQPVMAAGDDASAVLKYDWCFIGTLHSDRYRIVERLRRSDPARTAFVFGFAPSRLLLAARLLTDWSLWNVSRRLISTKPMAPADVARVCSASRAMLDIQHPRQRGLTMRTIETLLAGRKLITTNAHVVNCDLYHPSRVHIIERGKPEVPTAFFDSTFERLDEEIRAKYSLRSWIIDLIGQ